MTFVLYVGKGYCKRTQLGSCLLGPLRVVLSNYLSFRINEIRTIFNGGVTLRGAQA